MVIWQLSLTSGARRAENEVPERVEGVLWSAASGQVNSKLDGYQGVICYQCVR